MSEAHLASGLGRAGKSDTHRLLLIDIGVPPYIRDQARHGVHPTAGIPRARPAAPPLTHENRIKHGGCTVPVLALERCRDCR